MSNNDQSTNQPQNRLWAGLLPVLLLAPLAMAPKGCEPVVIGDDCPNETACTFGSAGATPSGAAGRSGSAGSAGGKPTGTGGSTPTGTGGSPPTGTGGHTPTGTGGSSPIGTAGSPDTGVCGGLAGLQCAANEYCAFDAACGATDQTGVCTLKPEICSQVYAPVCACNGQTYSSACDAAANGFSVLRTGKCEVSTPGAVCGGLRGTACGAKDLFCNFPVETRCGSGDQTGTCTNIPTQCTLQLAPVCGCDGNDYGNACAAAAAGTSVASNGPCATPATACGARLGDTCSADQYCSFTREDMCGFADATGICVAKLVGGCTANYAPVCGCDGKTYSNECEAGLAGTSVLKDGACP